MYRKKIVHIYTRVRLILYLTINYTHMEINPRLMKPYLVEDIGRSIIVGVKQTVNGCEVIGCSANAFGIHPFITRDPACLIIN